MHAQTVRRVVQVTLAACIILIAGAVPGGTAADRRQTLLDLERRWLAAEDDPDALETILADDFVHVLPFGLVSKKEQIAYLRAHPAPHREERFEDLRARLYGDVGIVNGIVAATDAEGNVTKTVFTDVFVRRGGRWQAVNAQELTMPAAR
jgi:hypothetical protein